MDLKEANKLVTKAKRIWGQFKRETIYSDKIAREEGPLFKDDLTLAGLVNDREILDEKIVEHIDKVLRENRPEFRPAAPDKILALLDMLDGVFVIDRNPAEVDLDWIRSNAFQLDTSYEAGQFKVIKDQLS